MLGIILMSILTIIGIGMVFKKFGLMPWEALVIAFDIIVLSELYKLNLGAFLAMLTITLLVFAKLNYQIAKAFKKGIPFIIGLTLLPMFFYPYLGFSKLKPELKEGIKVKYNI